MPKTVAYARVSTDKQAQHGTSIPDQTERMAAYAAFKQLPEHELLGTRMYVDAAVSSDLHMMERPAGAALCATLAEGDHLVIALFDRAFRSAADVEMAFTYFRSRNVTVHILDLNIDTSTIMGECMLSVMASIKRMEKRTIVERITRGVRYSYANGRPPCTVPPLGWKFTKQKIGKYRRITIDREYRSQATEIVRLKDEEKMSDRQVYAHLWKKRVVRSIMFGAKKRPEGVAEWTLGSIQRAYRVAKQGFPLPESLWEHCDSEYPQNRGPSTATLSPPPAEDSCSSPDSSDPPPV